MATIHGLWPLQNAQFGSRIKIAKNMPKQLYKRIRDVLLKNTGRRNIQEISNIQKVWRFLNWRKWPPCMGYSLCKILSLGQKLK